MDDRIIRTKIEAIRRSAVIARWPVGPWQARTADFVAVGEYRFDGDWTETAAESFWPAGKTLFIRTTAETPPGVPLEDLFLQFDAEGLEGLLTVNGRPYAGIDANHLRVLVPEAGTLRLEAEFVCLLASLHRAELRRERARLREVSFVQIDRAIEAAYYDLWFTYEASQQVKDARRKQLLHAALEAALLAIDLTAPADEYRRQVADARDILAERIGAIAPDPEAGRIYLTGHSHIDTAWLWPLRETVRKCSRTFATAARLMERYPDYRFSCSQPQLYAYTKKHFPALYEEIKKWVATGRWECTGGPWVESDCNVPSGEALIRQMLHGLRFFREEFGARPHSLWLPDVFGYPGVAAADPPGLRTARFLHQQAALAGAQRLSREPLLVGGHRRHARPGPHPEAAKRLQRLAESRTTTHRLGQLRAESGLRRAALPLRLRRRRRRTDRGDARVHRARNVVPRPARVPPGRRRGVFR